MTIDYRQDIAAIALNGAITSDFVCAFIDDIRHLRDDCFYRRLEIAIASPGGDILACERLLEFLDSLRRKGVRVDTAGSGQTASAAAFLLSMGDHRRASPDSRLTYHFSRTETPALVTAAAAGSAAATLTEIDRRMVVRLADRGLRAAQQRRVHELGTPTFRRDDHDAIRELLVVLSESRATGVSSDDASVQRLREILDPLRIDRRALEAVYRSLLTLDRPISPALALELLLIDDATGAPPPGRPHAGPSLCVPEWRAIWPEGRVGLEHLCRHTLILGETGSGKTVSGVMPVLKAILTPDSGVGCALVIDPKRELLPLVRRETDGARTIRAGSPGCPRSVLNLMGSSEWELDADLEAGRMQDAARKILVRSATLATESPARIWAGLSTADPNTAYWQQEGGTLASVALALTLAIVRRAPDIFAGQDSPASILSAPRALREALGTFAEFAGILPPQREFADAIEAALPKARAAQRESEHKRFERDTDLLQRTVDEVAGSLKASLQEKLGKPPEDHLVRAVESGMRQCVESIRVADDFTLGGGGSSVSPQAEHAGWSLLRDEVEQTRLYRSDSAFRRRFETLDRELGQSDAMFPLEEVARRTRLCAFSASDPDDVRPTPNVMALAQLALDLFLTPASGGEDPALPWDFPEIGGQPSPGGTAEGATDRRLMASSLVDALHSLFGPEFEPVRRSVRRAETLARSATGERESGHFVSILTIAQQVFREFAEAAPAWTLYFGVEPFWRKLARDETVDVIDFAEAVDAEDGLRVWVVLPKLVGDREILIAKAVKEAYFEAVLGNEARANRQPRPLVGYVADEFHRFVTAGHGHGEQSFMDTCRAFGAFCVLASQSVAGIEHALAEAGTDPARNAAAVSMLLNNTATKMFFRTTDDETIRRIGNLCPSKPGRPPVVAVRPPSTLSPGECYAVLPDGRFERQQLSQCFPGSADGLTNERQNPERRSRTGARPRRLSAVARLFQAAEED